MLVGLLSLWAAPAFAQGCAMCYSSAAATSREGQRAIDKGVAVLLAPPLGVMTLGVGMAFHIFLLELCEVAHGWYRGRLRLYCISNCRA